MIDRKDFSNAKKHHEYLKLFSDDELYQIFSKTNGICHKCTNLIQLTKFMSEGDGSWFVINSRDRPVYAKNEYNLHHLRPICSKCLDDLGVEDNYINY